jgi:spermidine/putrescine transport system substrate-binding protein
MNRRIFLLTIPGMAGCYRPGGARLNVLNWSEYVAPETIPGFEREHGVRVRYGVYESGEEMLARVMSGNSGWDVVFPSNYFIQPMRELGLLSRLDKSRLRHLDQLAAPFHEPPWDKRLEWSLPYMWGATGILYQADLKPPVTAWSGLWRPRLRNRVTMLDDPAEVLGACLKKLGHSLNSGNAEELSAARREAAAQKPLLRAYVNEIVRDQLVAGELLAAQVWRSTAMRAMEAAPGKLAFAYPAEGFPLYADNMVILRESGRKELAHAFLDYLSRPEVATRVAEVKLESTTNKAARALLPERLRNHPVLYPDAAVMSRGEWFQPLTASAQRLRDRLWTEIKSS